MKKKTETTDDKILEGYVRLVQAMLMYVFDRIRIKKSWHDKKLSTKMLSRKVNDLNELGSWLRGESAPIWFNILGLCTENSGKKMYDTFLSTLNDSVKFVKKLKREDVDKLTIDTIEESNKI